MDSVITYVNRVPLAGLMFVVAVGYLLGRATWRGVSVGPAGGTVAIALLLGSSGVTLENLYGAGAPPPLTVGMFGFSLFIYSVGFEAGPRFFASLGNRRGFQFVVVGVLVNVLAVITAWIMARLLKLDASTTAGLLAGALTSAPTYAAAAEIAPEPDKLSVTFALAYPVGLVGLVLAVQLLPRLLRDSFHSARQSGADEAPLSAPSSLRLAPQHAGHEVSRVFRVEEEGVAGRTLRELDLGRRTGCVVSRQRRDGVVNVPKGDTRLDRGDRVLAKGRVDELRQFEKMVGPEVEDHELTRNMPARRVHVSRRRAAGKTLAQLDLIRRYGVVVTAIESGQTLIEPTADVVLHAGDVVELAGEDLAMAAAARELGRYEPPTNHTNIAVYAGGILLGVMLGSVHFGPLDFSLGLATGLLIAGVVLGYLRRLGPFSAYVPRPARQLVRDLGILLFVTEAGLSAGEELASGTAYPVWQAVVGSAIVMLVPAVAAVWIGRRLLRMPVGDVWGSLAGGMTSSAALNVIRAAVRREHDPAVSYATAYAIGSVLVTVAGQVIVWLV